VGNGLVTRTDPPSGTSVQQRSTITVYVSLGKEQVKVPSVVGSTLAEALSQLPPEKFTVALSDGSDPSSPANQLSIVADMNPKPDAQVDKGSKVILTLKAASPSSGSDNSNNSGNSGTSSNPK
jgi:serine/threonine-protein kinase